MKRRSVAVLARLRTRMALVALMVPGTTGLLALLAGPANAITGGDSIITYNHAEPLR